MDTKVIEIKDLHVVAYLMLQGFKHEAPILKTGSVTFPFKDTPELQKHMLKFYNQEVLVIPQQFAMQLRTLHRLVDAVRMGGANNE